MEHIYAKILQDFEQGKTSRRQLIRNLARAVTGAAAVVAAAPAQTPAAAGTGLKAVSIGHISFDVADYKKTSDFYADFFGAKIFQGTNKNENHARIGETYITFRGPNIHKNAQPTPRVDHIAIAVEPWDNQNDPGLTGLGAGAPRLQAELKRRGIPLLPGTDIKVKDPEGFIVQIIGRRYETKN
ncbi:MAG: hypothetical protein A3H28_16660 [Acidobacteria bacterium RIFCSPLOWO2_02_FULL_61_28]|nr:MAG: hypothetical protein A3H28_16660 [Acidobacteria bacterium RIFCSPLOWO2_02_FULL_61_28]